MAEVGCEGWVSPRCHLSTEWRGPHAPRTLQPVLYRRDEADDLHDHGHARARVPADTGSGSDQVASSQVMPPCCYWAVILSMVSPPVPVTPFSKK